MPVFRKAILALVAMFIAVSAGLPAVAGEPGWKLQQAVGEVIVGGEGLKPVAVRRDDVVPLNGWVQTGKNGRAVLVRAGDMVVVAPGSRVSLPAERVNGNTQVLQSLGSVFYSISKEKVPHFQVDTPYMAAVVKGTSFIIAVENERSRIDVTDGLVQISNAGRTDVEYVRPGFSATVAHAQRGSEAPALQVTETSSLPPLPLPQAGAQPPAEQSPGEAATETDSLEEASAPAGGTEQAAQVVEAPVAGPALALALAEPARAVKPVVETDVTSAVSSASGSGSSVISVAIGEPRVDVGAVTGGLAEGASSSPRSDMAQPSPADVGAVTGGLAEGASSSPRSDMAQPSPASEGEDDAVVRDVTPVAGGGTDLAGGNKGTVSDGKDRGGKDGGKDRGGKDGGKDRGGKDGGKDRGGKDRGGKDRGGKDRGGKDGGRDRGG